MENFREKRLERQLKSQRSTSIVIAVILLLSIIGNIFLFVRNSRVTGEKEELESEKESLIEDIRAVEEANAQLQAEIQSLNQKIEEISVEVTNLELEIRKRENQIAQLRRQVFKEEELRQQIAELEGIEEEYNKLLEEKQELQGELQALKEELSQQKQQYEYLTEEVEEAAYLGAYNICAHHFRERWLCRPVAMEVARRIDLTTVSFEIGENLLVEPAEKDVHLLMIDPEGNVVNPSADTFTIEETGETSYFTHHAVIEYDHQPVPLNFDIEHDNSLESGNYRMEVYIDGEYARSKEFVLE